MTATKLISNAAIAALLSTVACDSTKSVTEAKGEANKAMDEHSKEVAEAKREPTRDEQLEAIDEANKEMVDEVADAYAHVDAKDTSPHGKARAAEEVDDPETDKEAGALSPDKRFAVFESESKQEFSARAHKMLAALDADLEHVKAKNVDAEDVRGVEEKLEEARRDLGEVENGTDKVVDDGKLGVTVAINSARRKLDRIQDDLADSK